MNKRDLIRTVTDVLRDHDVRKPISVPKQVFHISDNEGNTKDFTVKKTDKSVSYNKEDVAAIIETCLYVIKESLKRGEPVSIYGFGILGLNYRKPRSTKKFGTDEDIFIEGHYIPKFSFGNDLSTCAKLYELSLSDRLPMESGTEGDK